MEKRSILIWTLFAVALIALLAAIMHAYLTQREMDQSFARLREEQKMQMEDQASSMRASIIGELESKYEEDIVSYKKVEGDYKLARAKRVELAKVIVKEKAQLAKPLETPPSLEDPAAELKIPSSEDQ